MGRLKLLRFGFGAPELFCTEIVQPKSKGQGFENSLRNIASHEGLAYLVSPQIGQFWKILVMLKPNYLKDEKWSGYHKLKNSYFQAYLNFQVEDKSKDEQDHWQQYMGYPGVRLLMRRSSKIKIKYQTERKFDYMEQEVTGFESKIMQQAHDHLQALDPLTYALDFQIIDSKLKKEHDEEIRRYFSEFSAERGQNTPSGNGQLNPYKRTAPLNRFRRELIYSVCDANHN